MREVHPRSHRLTLKKRHTRKQQGHFLVRRCVPLDDYREERTETIGFSGGVLIWSKVVVLSVEVRPSDEERGYCAFAGERLSPVTAIFIPSSTWR